MRGTRKPADERKTMRIKFDNLRSPTQLDGVWRYPGEVANLAASMARAYVARGLATTACRRTLDDGNGSPQPAPRQPSVADPAAPRLYLNGREVDRFPERTDVRVSVVIPLYRSASYIPKLLSSLEGSDSTPYELVFVSDGDGRPEVPGKLVVLPENRGFAAAVNVGARHASGRLLCLLNADMKVRADPPDSRRAGWLAPMVRLMDSAPDVGAVGNRNLDRHGRIDSVGSEFNYTSGHFEHVLMGAADVPGTERDTVAERDMITAACLLVRRSAWEELGGLDEAYRIGYFEDSDFCMRLRDAGYRILYCPQSVVTHYKGHSGAGGHHLYRENAARFQRRWVRSGLVDKFAIQRGRRVHGGDVVACYIVLNEEEFIEASLESVYPLADRIIIVEGGNDYAVAAGWCEADRRSSDATVARVREFPDPAGKIELIQGTWKDKADQRSAYAERLKPGDWMLLMDGDEVFFETGLWRLSALMHSFDIIMPGFHLFWNNLDTLGTGKWEGFTQVKAVRWQTGYRYRDHNCPSDASGRPVTTLRGLKIHRDETEKLYAHYSWTKPLAKLRAKAAYYEQQPGASGAMRRRYIDEVFLAWRREPLRVERLYSTHPFGGGGTALFEGPHPEPVERRRKAGEFCWTT